MKLRLNPSFRRVLLAVMMSAAAIGSNMVYASDSYVVYDSPLNAYWYNVYGGKIWGINPVIDDSLDISGKSGVSYGGAIASLCSGTGSAIGSYSRTEIVDGEEKPVTYYVSGSGSLTLNGSSYSFANNEVKKDGGALHAADIYFNSCSSIHFKSNTAKKSGGAIYAGGDVLFSRCKNIEFDGNTAANGAVANVKEITFQNCSGITIKENRSNSSNIAGNLNIINCTGGISFLNNEATSGTGGVLNGNLVCTSSKGAIKFEGNKASLYGGVTYGGSHQIVGNADILFKGNSATEQGGVFYGASLINIEGNNKIRFEGNTASARGGVAVNGSMVASRNGSLSFVGNKATKENALSYWGDGGNGGALNMQTVNFENNVALLFQENQACSLGGAMVVGSDAGEWGASFELNKEVKFKGNKAGERGGAIYGGNIQFASNASVIFTDNDATQGGAVYSTGKVDFTGNSSILITDSNAEQGGAINGINVDLSENRYVTIKNNTASGVSTVLGGAISCSSLTITGNRLVDFSNNSTTGSSGDRIYGGAVYGSENVAICGNFGVKFSKNTVNSDKQAYGGALYVDWNKGIAINNNNNVEFSDNSVCAYNPDGSALWGHGGAISGSGSLELNDNSKVLFSGNSASSEGGAIWFSGNLSICNNDSVLFEKNAEKIDGSYRLRGLYVSNGDSVALSTLEQKNTIEFRDSAYIKLAPASSLELNADYTDANRKIHKQKGDIIFTGKYTAEHLKAVLIKDKAGRKATQEEITMSRTSEVTGLTNLHGGRLRVEEGAIYTGRGIESMSGSTVRLENGILNHEKYNLNFQYGATLSLGGINCVTANALTMQSGSTLAIDVSYRHQKDAALTINGNFQLPQDGGTLTLLLKSDNTIRSSCSYCLLKGVTKPLEWSEAVISVKAATVGWLVSFDDLTWKDDALWLYYDEKFNPDFGKEPGLSILEYAGNHKEGYNVYGGAVYADNGNHYNPDKYDIVRFENNSVSSERDGDAGGGAIYATGANVTLNNHGAVYLNSNYAQSEAGRAFGGAIGGDVLISLNNNGVVQLEKNYVSGVVGNGGAIYGNNIELNGNGTVKIQGNRAIAESSEGKAAEAHGGAIYAYGSLSIQNNNSVLFAQNIEKNDDSYRLRGVYVEGGVGSVVSLSAAADKSIEFQDTMYVGENSTVNLNAAYKGQAQLGDILFSGKYAETHLNEAMQADNAGRVASDEEILASRTTEVNTLTNLYGGRLRVEDGAVYQGQGIMVHENSAATVLVKDAALKHDSYDLVFSAGTTLAAEGVNSLSGNLVMLKGSNLDLTVGSVNSLDAVLTLDSVMNLQGATLNVKGAEYLLSGSYKLIADANYDSSSWGNDVVQINGCSNGNLLWEDGVLTLSFTNTGNAAANDGDVFENYRGNIVIGQAVVAFITGEISADEETNSKGHLIIDSGCAHLSSGASIAGDVVFTGAHAESRELVADDNVELGRVVLATSQSENSIITVENDSELYIGGIEGTGSLIKDGEGVINHTGTTAVERGSLEVKEGTLFNTGDLSFEKIELSGGHLDNQGSISSVEVNGGVLSGSGVFGGLTLNAGRLVVGNSPGLQQYTDDLHATGGELLFSVAGVTEAATSTCHGWESSLYSSIDMGGFNLSIGSDTILTIAFGGSLLDDFEGDFCIVLFSNIGNIDSFTEDMMAMLQNNTQFVVTEETQGLRDGWIAGDDVSALVSDVKYSISDSNVMISGHLALVPEPTTASLSLLALASLCARRRRK